jgi:uncharacterized OB-fold protein
MSTGSTASQDGAAGHRWDEPFWTGIDAGVLRYQQCEQCGHSTFPARRFCPQCASPELAWKDSQGRGQVYTFSVVERGALPQFESQTPYTVGVVRLAEGFQMSTRIVRVDPSDVACDMPVQVVFDYEQVTLPCFEPAAKPS